MFRPNPRFLTELMQEPEAPAALVEQAEAAKSAIESVAPVGSTGDYADSIEVVQEGEIVTVGSMDPFAHLVEWGSANNPPYAPLRRGVLGAGLRFEEQPK